MLYIENLAMDACFNQALEEYAFDRIRQDDVLLLWRNDPAVVCGRNQNLFAEVDVLEARRRGVTLVRRITGGGTVYQDPGNLNYAFITSKDSSQVDYARFLNPVRQILHGLGIPAEIILSSGLAVDGRKISGSAQRIVKNRVLHHGTLLYDCDLTALRTLANGQRPYFSSSGTPSTPWPVTNIRDLLPEAPAVEVFQHDLLLGFAALWPMRTMHLDSQQLWDIEILAEKYRSWEWTMGANPPFKFARQISVAGTSYSVTYQSINGRILEFTMDPPVPGVSQVLSGVPLEPDALRAALTQCSGFTGLAELIL